MALKKALHLPVHPERICWGCDRYCPANDLACGNGTVRAPHPIELFGPDWQQVGLSPPEQRPHVPEPTPMQRISDYLIADHARLHVLLERSRAGAQLDREAFGEFRAGLLRHIGIEEKLLFPAVREALGGVPMQAAQALRVEHAAIASLLVPTPDIALAGELAGLLEGHDAAEEGPDGVYDQCERVLGEQSSQALAERARAAPEVPVAAHYDGPTVHRTAASALAAAKRSAAQRSAAQRAAPKPEP